MRTMIYWTIQHTRTATREMRFRARCWWFSQQVEFLGWRLRLECVMPSMERHGAALAGES